MTTGSVLSQESTRSPPAFPLDAPSSPSPPDPPPSLPSPPPSLPSLLPRLAFISIPICSLSNPSVMCGISASIYPISGCHRRARYLTRLPSIDGFVGSQPGLAIHPVLPGLRQSRHSSTNQWLCASRYREPGHNAPMTCDEVLLAASCNSLPPRTMSSCSPRGRAPAQSALASPFRVTCSLTTSHPPCPSVTHIPSNPQPSLPYPSLVPCLVPPSVSRGPIRGRRGT